MVEAVRPVHVRIDAQRISGIHKIEQVGIVGPRTAESEAAVQLVPVPDGLIQPRLQRVHVRVVQHLGLIVVARVSRQARQRLRIQIQQGRRLRADRNDAGNRQPGRGIVDRHWLPLRVQQASQVAASLVRGRHQPRLVCRIRIARPLVGDKEIRPIRQQVGNAQRAAQRHHHRDPAVRVLGRLLPSQRVGPRIEHRVVRDRSDAAVVEALGSGPPIAECGREIELRSRSIILAAVDQQSVGCLFVAFLRRRRGALRLRRLLRRGLCFGSRARLQRLGNLRLRQHLRKVQQLQFPIALRLIAGYRHLAIECRKAAHLDFNLPCAVSKVCELVQTLPVSHGREPLAVLRHRHRRARNRHAVEEDLPVILPSRGQARCAEQRQDAQQQDLYRAPHHQSIPIMCLVG